MVRFAGLFFGDIPCTTGAVEKSMRLTTSTHAWLLAMGIPAAIAVSSSLDEAISQPPLS
jgi:hypothetical protein